LGRAIGMIALVALLVTVRNAGLVAAEYDNRIVSRLAEHRSGWLTDVMRPLGYLATGPALVLLWIINLAVLACELSKGRLELDAKGSGS
jgi:hypothetical protein